jgi:hypothetical protein
MTSAELAADTFLESKPWQTYEHTLRRHEVTATKMVEMFYLASNNWLLRKLVPRISTPRVLRNSERSSGATSPRTPYSSR